MMTGLYVGACGAALGAAALRQEQRDKELSRRKPEPFPAASRLRARGARCMRRNRRADRGKASYSPFAAAPPLVSTDGPAVQAFRKGSL